MVGEPGQHDVGWQTRCREALVDDVRRYRRLDIVRGSAVVSVHL